MSIETADDAYQKATKLAGITKGFGSKFFGKASISNSEQAASLYQKAGDIYKINKQYAKAANAYSESGKMMWRCGSKFDSAGSYTKAAQAFASNDDIEQAVKCYIKSAESFSDIRRFNMSGKQYLAAGELQYKRLNDLPKAVSSYTKAAELYADEKQPAAAGKAYLAIAEIEIEQGNYTRAKALFEKIAHHAKDSRLLIYGAKNHYFKAVLCAFAMDYIHARVVIRQYVEEHPAFQDSKEYKFCMEIMNAFQNDSVPLFNASVANFRKFSTVDASLLRFLTELKKTIPSYRPEDDEAQMNLRSKAEYLVDPPGAARKRSNYLRSKTTTDATNESSAPIVEPQSANFREPNPFLDDEEDDNDRSALSKSASYNPFLGSNNPFEANYRDASDDELDLR